MKIKDFYQNHKKLVIILAIIGLIVLGFVVKKINQKPPISAAQDIVKKVDLINVDNYTNSLDRIATTGTIQATSQAEVRSQISGEVRGIYASIGDSIPNHMPVIELDTELQGIQVQQAQAAVDQAQASLDLRISGPSQATIAQAKTSIEVAKTGLESAKHNLDRLKVSNKSRLLAAEHALEQAKNNLQFGDNGTSSYLLVHTYENIVAQIKNSMVITDEALTLSNNILGVEPEMISSSYLDNIGVLDYLKYSEANTLYSKVKNKQYKYLSVEIEALPLNFKLHQQNQVDDLFDKTVVLIDNIEQLLILTREVVETSMVGDQYTSEIHIQFLSQVDAMKEKLTGEIKALNGLQKVRTDTITGYDNATLIYEQAQENLDDTIKQNAIDLANAQTAIKTQTAAVAQAQAGLNALVETPRAIDLAPLQAGVAASEAALETSRYQVDKGLIRSPIDGEITDILVEFGDFINPGQVLFRVANTNALEVLAYVTEDDIKKISQNAKVFVNDFYEGKVIERSAAVDPVTKKVKVIIYITAPRVDLTLGEIVRVSIETNPDIADTDKVYTIPLSAVKIKQNDSFIGMLNADNFIDYIPVELGDVIGKKVQIIEGIKPNSEILSSLKGLEQGDYVISADEANAN